MKRSRIRKNEILDSLGSKKKVHTLPERFEGGRKRTKRR